MATDKIFKMSKIENLICYFVIMSKTLIMVLTRSQTNLINSNKFCTIEDYIYRHWIPESFDVSRRLAFMLGKGIAKKYEPDMSLMFDVYHNLVIKTSKGLKKISIKAYPISYLETYDELIKDIIEVYSFEDMYSKAAYDAIKPAC